MQIAFLNEQKAYVLSSCDEWKSYSSMRTIGVFTNERALRKAIKDEIKKNNFEIDDIGRVDKDDLHTLSACLDYGNVQEFQLNKVE